MSGPPRGAAIVPALIAAFALVSGCASRDGRGSHAATAPASGRLPTTSASPPGVEMSRDPAFRSSNATLAAPLSPIGDAVPAPDVYARLAPSIAFIETPLATGTGIVIGGGRLVTNAHVLWPFDHARVVFSDGREIEAATVAAIDGMADLAVLDLDTEDPNTSEIPAARMADGSSLPIGSDVYLIGYPAETEALPQPTLTRGILSRQRTWEALGLRFLQTDADLAGGQSGGALAAADGSVIGVSGMIFGEEAFGLAMSMPDVLARVDRFDAATSGAERSRSWLVTDRRGPSHDARLDDVWSEAVYVVPAAFGTPVEVEARARETGVAVFLDVIDPYGDAVDAGEDAGGAWGAHGVGSAASGGGRAMARQSFAVDADGPYFVVVTADPGGIVDVRANIPIASLLDRDDGRELTPSAQPDTPGVAYEATMDYPGDVDAFALTLAAGESVRVLVESLNFSPEIVVDHPERPDLVPAALDTSAPSALGLAAKVELEAPEATTYRVVVRDYDAMGVGGYLIRVEIDPPPEGTPDR